MKSSSTSSGNNDEVRVANGILVVDEDPLICELRDILESTEIKFRTSNNSWRAAILVREEFLLRLILAAEAQVKSSRAQLCR